MAYKRLVAAAVFAAMVASSAQAQSVSVGCRKKCDASFSTCSKRSKSGDSTCLRTWHKCKSQCTVAAATPKPKPKTAALASAQPKRQ